MTDPAPARLLKTGPGSPRPELTAALIIIGNIGDVLLLEPSIRYLRQHGRTLDIYCTAETAMVWEGDPRIREVVPIRSSNQLYQSRAGLNPLLVKRRHYEELFDFLPTARSAKITLRLSARQRSTWEGEKSRRWFRRLLYNRPLTPPGPWIRRDHFYLSLLGLSESEMKRFLPARASVDENELRAFRERYAYFRKAPGERIVILQPTARWKRKLWTVEKWRDLITRLGAIQNLRMVLISGPVAEEQEMVRSIAQGLVTSEAVFPGTFPWNELRSALAAVDAFVGLDSAPYHLAAMLGKPLVVLFGSADERNWGPVLPRQVSIKAPVVDGEYRTSEIPVNAVQEAVDAALTTS